ncbi:hypothetical protein ACFX10_023499 [Malus domestica]
MGYICLKMVKHCVPQTWNKPIPRGRRDAKTPKICPVEQPVPPIFGAPNAGRNASSRSVPSPQLPPYDVVEGVEFNFKLSGRLRGAEISSPAQGLGVPFQSSSRSPVQLQIYPLHLFFDETDNLRGAEISSPAQALHEPLHLFSQVLKIRSLEEQDSSNISSSGERLYSMLLMFCCS